MTHLDGNVLAGPLGEHFTDDVTTASAECSGCGDVAVLAQAMVYQRDHAWTVRCRACGDVLLVVARIGERMRLDVRGISALTL
jgi:hypothetical protein